MIEFFIAVSLRMVFDLDIEIASRMCLIWKARLGNMLPRVPEPPVNRSIGCR